MATFYSIMKPAGVFAFDGEVVGGSAKAVKVRVGKGEIWLPRSVLTDTCDGVEVAPWFRYDERKMAVIEPVSRFYNGSAL